MKKRVFTSVALLAGLGGASAQFVDVDFTAESVGPATSVVNGGTLGGVFEAIATGVNNPQIEGATFDVPQSFLPYLTTGTPGLVIDGDDFLTHTDGAGTFINAPAGIIGVDPTRSVEAWVFNPSLATEETVVAWGKRGGAAGTNASYNYGNAQAFGAIGHWGGQDIGWTPGLDAGGNAGPSPAAGEWHHLAWTYDGTTTRVYSDGVEMNSEVLGPGAINTHGNTPITIGGQLEASSADQAPNFTQLIGGTMTIGAVKVHDGVLSGGDVQAAYNARSGDFTPASLAAPTASALRSAPENRWTFNLGDVVGGGESGTIVMDVIGGAHGEVLGDGATVNGTQVDLPGGGSGTAAYVDLPNGLVSSKSSSNGGSGELTLEFWGTAQGNQTWGRMFDFGSTMGTGPLADGGGEVIGPGNTNGGGDQGVDYLIWSAQVGGNTGVMRAEWKDRDGAADVGVVRDFAAPPHGDEFHGVMTVDEALGEMIVYVNGEFVTYSGLPAGIDLSDINDVNNWLGRSNWQGDANGDVAFNEFRIYDYALNRDEVFGNFNVGPDTLNVIPEPTALALIGLTGLALIFRRRQG